MKTIKTIVLTKEEDQYYSDLMEINLNCGYSERKAEIETINELKNKFPRLKELLTGNYKISLETIKL